MPLFEDPYDSPNEKRRYVLSCMRSTAPAYGITTRLTTLYQVLYDAIHAKSGQEHTLKLQYLKTSQESVMGWV